MIYRVGPEEAGQRFDVYLAAAAKISRSAAERQIENGSALLNGCQAPKKTPVSEGDAVDFTLLEPAACSCAAQSIPLDIVYEDADLVVVNKPAGMVVHPAAGNPDGTLVNALLAHCGETLSGIGGEMRPGIVHRIDKETSGLIAVAKNDEAHLALSEQLKDKTMSRIYLAVVRGCPREQEGRIDRPIGRSPKDRKKMAIVPDGRHAATRYQVLERFDGWSLLRLELETGRTHQIRVHMASIGHPLMGDCLYSSSNTPFESRHRDWLPGQLLHAAELRLVHPRTGEKMCFSAPIPANFEAVLDVLRRSQNV
ncbi:MAG: RluA family pseudouridine synthase [Eubacteriales bacterium]|nr:RluA family pseudouridine synthase [Eubacteriales bacterium]